MPKVSEEHRAARRDQILSAALRCAAREGFHKTTMSAVISESGLSAGAVYLYFRNKAELIQALAGVAISGVAGAVADLAAGEQVVEPEEAVAVAARRVLELSAELGVELPRLALQAWAEAARDPEILALIQGEAGRIREAWIAYAVRAVEVGHFAPDVEPEQVGEALMALLPGFMLFRVVLGVDVTPERYTAGLAALRRL